MRTYLTTQVKVAAGMYFDALHRNARRTKYLKLLACFEVVPIRPGRISSWVAFNGLIRLCVR